MPNNKIIDLDRLSRFKDKLDLELEKKANVDGNYPTMTVGAADSLTPYGENSGANDTTPFVFQSTGGSSDVGSKAYLRELRGNTVAFNQLSDNALSTTTQNGITLTNNANGSFTISGTASAETTFELNTYDHRLFTIVGHKYLLKATGLTGQSAATYDVRVPGIGRIDGSSNYIIASCSSSANYVNLVVRNGTAITTPITFTPQLFDLTLMFGAGNEPTSVLEFIRLFPKPYYEYNAGTLLSCKANGIKNVGYNAFDEELELGTINQTTGENESGTSTIRTKNTIKVIAGQNYTIETVENYNAIRIFEYDGNSNLLSTSVQFVGANASINYVLSNNTHYVRFVFAVNNVPTNPQIAFHLTWDGSRTGFEEHQEWQYNLPNIELRSAGSAYDVLYSTGGGKRRVGVVDLGTLNWTVSSDGYFVAKINNQKVYGVNSTENNMKCSKYQTYSNLDRAAYTDKGINIGYTGDTSWSIRAKDTSISSDNATTFKNGLNGVYLFYELDEETDITTEENPGWQNPQDIDDFGTQEFLYDSNIDIPIPQGNEFFYPVDYKAFIDSLGGREDIEYDASKIVSHTELSASEDDRDKIDTQLSNAISGTLRQLLALTNNISFSNTLIIDLSIITWNYDSVNQRFISSTALTNGKAVSSAADKPSFVCTKYEVIDLNHLSSNLQISQYTNGNVYIKDTNYTDATTFKNAMKGVLLAYEKA